MKENFVIREERHPIGLAIRIYASIMKFISCIMYFVMLGMGVPPLTIIIGVGAVHFFWWIVGKVCENLCKEFYYCEFDVEGLKVTYEYDGEDPCLTVNGKETIVIVGYNKIPAGAKHYNPNVTKGGYARRSVSRNHELKLFHSGSKRYPNCCILLDDVVIVEHGLVYVDKIHEILSGSPVGIYRFSIVGQTGVFENKRFDVTTTLVLGRDAAECNVAFPSDTAGVSRVHCKFVVEDDDLCVYDLGSTYGTVINNNKTLSANQRMKLKHGATVTIGSNQTFVVREM